jgi:hypothetical protein
MPIRKRTAAPTAMPAVAPTERCGFELVFPALLAWVSPAVMLMAS